MVKLFCDICNKEIEIKDKINVSTQYHAKYWVQNDYIICKDCYRDVFKTPIIE